MPKYITRPKKTLVEVISQPRISATLGTVYWQQNFINNIAVFTNSTLINTPALVRSGLYCMKIESAGVDPWTTVANCKCIAGTEKLNTSKLGCEMFVNMEAITTTNLSSVGFRYDAYTDSDHHYVGIRIKLGAGAADAKLQYLASDGITWTDIPDSTFTATAGYYYRLKLTWDPVSGKYDKVYFGTRIFDLSAISYKKIASAALMIINFNIDVIGIDATVKDAYISDISLTYDEP